MRHLSDCSFPESFTGSHPSRVSFQALPLLPKPVVLQWYHWFPFLRCSKWTFPTTHPTVRCGYWTGTSNLACPKWNSLFSPLQLIYFPGFSISVNYIPIYPVFLFGNYRIKDVEGGFIPHNSKQCHSHRPRMKLMLCSVQPAELTMQHSQHWTTCSIISTVTGCLILYTRGESDDDSQFIRGPLLNIHDTLSQSKVS